MSVKSDLSSIQIDEPSEPGNYPRGPMQTRLLLIASALLAVIILIAGAVWLFQILT